jgi:hypothetical protein
MSADEIFFKADSRNLPKVDVFMIGEYFNKNDCYNVVKYFYIPLLQCSSISIHKRAFWFATYFYYRMLWQHQ